MTGDRAGFIRAQTAIGEAPLLPGIVLHLATEITPIWQASEAFLEQHGIEPPFWAFAWPGSVALSLAMPLLVIWCSAAGLLGGMVSANIEMGLSYGYFIDTLPRAVPLANLWIGLGKGFFFGFLIALVACHFGLKVRPNTESLSARTTTAVVTSITLVIIADAIFAVLTRSVGMP